MFNFVVIIRDRKVKYIGIKISENTAKNQKGKWIFINGELYRKKKNRPKITIINEPAKEPEN